MIPTTLIRNIVCFGMAVIPFMLWQGYDSREPKIITALLLSLGLVLVGLFKGVLKPYNNKWLLLLILFLPFNYLLAPKFTLFIANIPMPSWIYEAMLFIIVFFLGHVTISSVKFTKPDIELIMKTALYSASITALYMCLQRLGVDQFFLNPSNAMCGTFGNSNIASAFVAMVIPLALYLRKYKFLMLVPVVLLADSQVTWVAMTVSLVFIVCIRYPRTKLIMLSIFLGLCVIATCLYLKNPTQDHGRFKVWSLIVADVGKPFTLDGQGVKKYSFTGFGLNTFKYMFHAEHPKVAVGEYFIEAHCEYLEILYNIGIVGLTLFLLALYTFIRGCSPLNRLKTYLLGSFICIAVNACGSFVWHNGAIIFYTLVITALLVQDPSH